MPKIGIVTELCPHGDVEAFMLEKDKETGLRRGESMVLNERLRILFECASAMQYLHQHNIVHRDLKLKNVLVDQSLTFKIIDFGLSKLNTGQTMTKRVGTSFFIAPEVTLSNHYDGKADVFSFGMMVWFSIFFFFFFKLTFFFFNRFSN